MPDRLRSCAPGEFELELLIGIASGTGIQLTNEMCAYLKISVDMNLQFE